MKMEEILLYGGNSLAIRYIKDLLNKNPECAEKAESADKAECADKAEFSDKRLPAVYCPGHDTTAEEARKVLKSLAPERPVSLTLLLEWQPEAGPHYAEIEREARMFAEAAGIPLAILRTGMLFGSGVGGYAERIFSDVINARYIHVRGCNGTLPLLTALDAARAVISTIGLTGEFTLTDGSSTTWKQLAEAMSANTGENKRMPALPLKWARLAWKVGRWLPAVKASCSPAIIALRSSDIKIPAGECPQGFNPFSVVDVLSRQAPGYPYQDH